MTLNKIKSLQMFERRYSGVHNQNAKQIEKTATTSTNKTVCLMNFLAASEIDVIRCDKMKFSEIHQLPTLVYCVARIPMIACYFSLKLYLSSVFLYILCVFAVEWVLFAITMIRFIYYFKRKMFAQWFDEEVKTVVRCMFANCSTLHRINDNNNNYNVYTEYNRRRKCNKQQIKQGAMVEMQR